MSIVKRMRYAWSHNFGLRLGVSLSLILFLVMGTGTAFLVIQQNHALRQAAEERARAVARTFAAIGSAAVLDNLYRLQESLQLYMRDDSLLDIDIVDNDSMVVAAKHPGRIGTLLDDPGWLEARKTKREVILETFLDEGGSTLVIIEPLFDRNELTAWVRMVVSLSQIEREQAQTLWRLLAVTLTIMLVGLYAIRHVLQKTSTVLQGVVSTLQTAGVPLGSGESALAHSVSQDTPRGDFERLLAVATGTAIAMSAQTRALQDLTQSLESKVIERTNDLEEARAQAVRSLEELREKEARLRNLVDHAADGILVTDAQWIIESVNPAACLLFGHNAAELRGHAIQTLLYRTTRGSDLVKTGSEQPFLVVGTGEEAVGRHKDGTSFQIELSISQMVIAGAAHYTIIVRDVTERRHMEEMKQRSAQRLHRLGEERAQLYHDLHASLLQSLSAVSMGMEASKLLLIQAPNRAPKQLDLALSHLHRVIQETRDFTARLEPRTAPHDSLLHSLQLLVQRNDSWPCPHFLINVDPVAAGKLSVEQEIHLLAIAREAVSNTVHHAQANSGSIRFELREGTARLEILDDGIGFRPAEIGHNSLGFMNMATHVKNLQGHLTIESVPGEGTAILVAIPQPQEAQLPERSAQES
jgi:two-component system CheB/CheR fusion protein